MKILITSGGTRVPVNRVRSITNTSSGRFGSELATAALMNRHEVIFLAATGSRSPFRPLTDLLTVRPTAADLQRIVDFCDEHRDRFREVPYDTYDEYAAKLTEVLETDRPEAVVLAAAVSDYVPKAVFDGKVRSGSDLTIRLRPAEKLISRVRKILPDCVLCGFKLTVDSNEPDMIDVAWDSIDTNGCDVVVANDLTSLEAGRHRICIVTPQGEGVKTEWLEHGKGMRVIEELELIASRKCTTC